MRYYSEDEVKEIIAATAKAAAEKAYCESHEVAVLAAEMIREDGAFEEPQEDFEDFHTMHGLAVEFLGELAKSLQMVSLVQTQIHAKEFYAEFLSEKNAARNERMAG